MSRRVVGDDAQQQQDATVEDDSGQVDLAFAERVSVLSCDRFAILASEAEAEQASSGAVAAQVRVPSRRVSLVPQSAQGTPRSIQDVAASQFDQTRGDSDVAIEDEDIISTAADPVPADPLPGGDSASCGSLQWRSQAKWFQAVPMRHL